MKSPVKNLNSSLESSGYIWLWVGIILIIAVIGFLQLLGTDDQQYLLKEGGLFETLTVLGYLVCLILIYIYWTWQKVTAQWYFSALIILFALRELDYDKIYFTVGLLKARQYTGDLVPLPELVLSVLIIIGILTVLTFIIVKETRSFLVGLATYKLSSLAIMVSFILVFLTKTLDGLPRKLATLGFDVTPPLQQLIFACEEVGEMGIPIMFGIAIVSSKSKY